MKKRSREFTERTDDAQNINDELLKIQVRLLPKFGQNWHRHSLVGLKVEALARILYYADLYKKIINVPGVICEFGVQWGATLTELINLRSIYEPFNHSRTIYGFDTFEGFTSLSGKDGGYSSVGDYSSTKQYEETLQEILKLHESAAPMAHIEKFKLIKGDASVTVDAWLKENPHAIVSMAIFDMDLFKPTSDVLEKIVPRLTKGSLLVFDELNCKYFPGETIALREVIGTNNLRLQRTPIQPFCSWAIWGDD
ncbi:MAG: TylF/MycF/NovP-related O-methyltransferase [Leptospirales bacterium]